MRLTKYQIPEPDVTFWVAVEYGDFDVSDLIRLLERVNAEPVVAGNWRFAAGTVKLAGISGAVAENGCWGRLYRFDVRRRGWGLSLLDVRSGEVRTAWEPVRTNLHEIVSAGRLLWPPDDKAVPEFDLATGEWRFSPAGTWHDRPALL